MKNLQTWSGDRLTKIQEFKESMKNVRKQLELPTESAMPCEVQNHQCTEPCGKESDTRRSKYACIVEAQKSTRKRLERTLPEDREDRIAGKGFNLVHKFTSKPQAMKIPDAKVAGDKEWEKLEISFCYGDGHLSSQECGVGTNISEI